MNIRILLVNMCLFKDEIQQVFIMNTTSMNIVHCEQCLYERPLGLTS